VRRELLGSDEVVGEDTCEVKHVDELNQADLPLSWGEEVAYDLGVLHVGLSVEDGWLIVGVPKLPRRMKE
jgi:hypothetical protein